MKGFQLDSLLSIMLGYHLVVLAPTGSGKSFVSLLALAFFLLENTDAVVWFVEPTRAILRDQIKSIKDKKLGWVKTT